MLRGFERPLDHRVVLRLADEKPNCRLVCRVLEDVVDCRDVKPQLPQVFGGELHGLDLDDDVPVEVHVEEQQIGEHLLLSNLKAVFASDEHESLAKLKEADISAKSLLIMQEPSMQRRMYAGFAKELKGQPDALILNYAPYLPILYAKNGSLRFLRQYWGLWDIKHYVTLLLGDISRLRDDENGYGPKGKGFISHVDIPPEVENAFHFLNSSHLGTVRTANPAFSS